MKTKFTLAAIQELDLGKIATAYDRACQEAVLDCRDRPGEKKARTVILQLRIVPDGDEGHCDTVAGEFDIQVKIPKRQSRTYSMGVKQDGTLIVNPESPDSIRQGTLDER